MSDIKQAKRVLLAEYERERDELNVFIVRLRRELGIGPEDAKGEPETTVAVGQSSMNGNVKVDGFVKPGDFYKMSQAGAAREFLERRGERNTASLQEIAAALLRGKAIETALDEKGLRNLSSMMSKHDDFESVAKGRWGLAKWYGGKDKKSKKPDTDAGVDSPDVESTEEKPTA